MMDASRWPEQRHLVKALFGCPLRVLLAGWILERRGEPFFLQEAQDALHEHGEARTAVRAELESFVEYELMSRFPEGRRVYYTQIAHPLWTALEAAVVALGLSSPDELERGWPKSEASNR